MIQRQSKKSTSKTLQEDMSFFLKSWKLSSMSWKPTAGALVELQLTIRLQNKGKMKVPVTRLPIFLTLLAIAKSQPLLKHF